MVGTGTVTGSASGQSAWEAVSVPSWIKGPSQDRSASSLAELVVVGGWAAVGAAMRVAGRGSASPASSSCARGSGGGGRSKDDGRGLLLLVVAVLVVLASAWPWSMERPDIVVARLRRCEGSKVMFCLGMMADD